jgi:hypothetical protein
MAQSNSAQYFQTAGLGFKPLLAIRDFLALLSSAWDEAKLMEQKSRKNSANW